MKQFILQLLILFLIANPLQAQDKRANGERRACNGEVSLYLDDDKLWTRDAIALMKMKQVVTLPIDGKKPNQGIPLSALIKDSKEPVLAVQIETCDGKIRRFEGSKLAKKQASLYFVITNYRGFKLFNTDGEQGRGSRMKNIDRVRLLTKP